MVISMSKAEYITAASAMQTVIWLHMLLRKLKVPIGGPMLLLGNNQSTNILMQGYVNYSHAKHINVWYHFIQEYVEWGELEVKYVSSTDNLANLLIKGISWDHQCKLVACLVISGI